MAGAVGPLYDWGRGERRWGLQTMSCGCFKRLAEDSLDFEARRIPLAPRVPVGASSETLGAPRLVRGTTRSPGAREHSHAGAWERVSGRSTRTPVPAPGSRFPTPFTLVNRCSKSIPKTAISAIFGGLLCGYQRQGSLGNTLRHHEIGQNRWSAGSFKTECV